MLNWFDVYQKYIVRFSDRINKVVRPLNEHFSIPFFGYHKIDLQGRYVSLMNHPEWGEYYIANTLYKNDPYLQYPDSYREGICFFSGGVSAKNRPLFEGWNKKVPAEDGIVLIEKKKTTVEFFIFACNSSSNLIPKLFMNHVKLLKSFSDYFKKECASILACQEQEGYRLPLTSDTSINPKLDRSLQVSFHASIGLQKQCQEFNSLTAREKDCLRLLYAGMSIKGIAAALSLSPRTVEHYLRYVKDKLYCRTKEELMSKASVFDGMDLF